MSGGGTETHKHPLNSMGWANEERLKLLMRAWVPALLPSIIEDKINFYINTCEP